MSKGLAPTIDDQARATNGSGKEYKEDASEDIMDQNCGDEATNLTDLLVLGCFLRFAFADSASISAASLKS
jgi:hypothetical protein